MHINSLTVGDKLYKLCITPGGELLFDVATYVEPTIKGGVRVRPSGSSLTCVIPDVREWALSPKEAYTAELVYLTSQAELAQTNLNKHDYERKVLDEKAEKARAIRDYVRDNEGMLVELHDRKGT